MSETFDQDEQRQARLLGRIVDGREGMDAAWDEAEAMDAAVTANWLRQGFGDEPALDSAFDARLRERLVADTGARARTVPLHRRPWARATLAAALIMLIIGPFWLLSRQFGAEPFGDQEMKKLKRIEYYDKKYESRLDLLRDRLRQGVSDDIAVRTSLDRSNERFEIIRKKRQDERRLSRIREYTSGGNEI